MAEAAVEERAAAKINLDLFVLGRRPDGLHELDSVVVFADLADRLVLRSAPGGEAPELVVDGPEAAEVPRDETNLVLRAARRLGADAGRCPGVRIHLEKNLPVAAGIGGGSADAAATLRGLNRLWRLGWSEARLEVLARALGADVPVCLRSRPVRMRGLGERLDELARFPRLHLLLVNPRLGVPTGRVFQALRAPPVDPGRPLPDPPAERWKARGRNDLEAPALRLEPGIGEVLDLLGALPGVILARMSGSGATCFGWFPGAAAARAAGDALRARRPGWWIREVLTRGP